MHHCLYITEIIGKVVESLADDYYAASLNDDSELYVSLPNYDEYASALNALARMCKVFQEPALNALWWRQGSLGNLVRCMPKDLWEVTDNGELVCLTSATRIPA